MTLEELKEHLATATAQHGLPAVLKAVIESWVETEDARRRLAEVSAAEAQLSQQQEEGQT
jgi:hypothetical protein